MTERIVQMSKKFTPQEMRDMAENIIMSEDDWIEDAAYMLRQSADTYEKIEGEIKRLKDLLVPTCHNCRYRCAFRNGKTHCEKHVRDGSEVELVANIKYLKEFINGKKV